MSGTSSDSEMEHTPADCSDIVPTSDCTSLMAATFCGKASTSAPTSSKPCGTYDGDDSSSEDDQWEPTKA